MIVVAALSLCACSRGDSRASFCAAIKKMGVQYAGLQDNPTPALIKSAAASAQRLVGIAPAEIKSAVKTEADSYNQWAKTGNPSALEGNKFSAADDQINTYVSEYCKQ
jgi:hypothetical protein